MFWITVLYHVSFGNIFSQSVVYLVFLTWCFIERIFLILMKSNLSIISFVDCVFGVVSKKSSPYARSSRFSPVLSPESFIVLHFTFRSSCLDGCCLGGGEADSWFFLLCHLP